MWKQQADIEPHKNTLLTYNFPRLQRFLPLPVGHDHIWFFFFGWLFALSELELRAWFVFPGIYGGIYCLWLFHQLWECRCTAAGWSWLCKGRARLCDTKHSSRSVKAFHSPGGCLTSQYSVFCPTKPQSLGVILVGLEVFTSPCGCEVMRCYHGIPTTQANSAGDISGSPEPALT